MDNKPFRAAHNSYTLIARVVIISVRATSHTDSSRLRFFRLRRLGDPTTSVPIDSLRG